MIFYSILSFLNPLGYLLTVLILLISFKSKISIRSLYVTMILLSCITILEIQTLFQIGISEKWKIWLPFLILVASALALPVRLKTYRFFPQFLYVSVVLCYISTGLSLDFFVTSKSENITICSFIVFLTGYLNYKRPKIYATLTLVGSMLLLCLILDSRLGFLCTIFTFGSYYVLRVNHRVIRTLFFLIPTLCVSLTFFLIFREFETVISAAWSQEDVGKGSVLQRMFAIKLGFENSTTRVDLFPEGLSSQSFQDLYFRGEGAPHGLLPILSIDLGIWFYPIIMLIAFFANRPFFLPLLLVSFMPSKGFLLNPFALYSIAMLHKSIVCSTLVKSTHNDGVTRNEHQYRKLS